MRLSVERVRATIGVDNPDRGTLELFAREGVHVPVAPSFEPSGISNRPHLRAKYVESRGAVDRMIVEEFREKELVFILPVEELANVAEAINLSVLSWAPKQGKVKGRNLNDCSYGGAPESALNSPEAKEIVEREWGKIQHPTLQDLVAMINDLFTSEKRRDDTVRWEDLRLWKMDLAGAFTLLDFRPEDVRLMAAEMSGNLIVFFACGIFGWVGMPGSFQVINRALMYELMRPGMLRGKAKMYVDDMLGVCWAWDLTADLECTRLLCVRLLGDTAVAEIKTEHGRRLIMIGWVIDLDERLVAVARRNVMKAFYGFSVLQVDAPVAMRVIQKLASWAERYGEVCFYMRPLRRALYGLVNPKKQNCSVHLSVGARRVIRLLQALFALMVLREGDFSRPLSSFGHDGGGV